jgi:hypothetical protein
MQVQTQQKEFQSVVVTLTSQAEVDLVYAAMRNSSITLAFGIPNTDMTYEALEPFVSAPDVAYAALDKKLK